MGGRRGRPGVRAYLLGEPTMRANALYRGLAIGSLAVAMTLTVISSSEARFGGGGFHSMSMGGGGRGHMMSRNMGVANDRAKSTRLAHTCNCDHKPSGGNRRPPGGHPTREHERPHFHPIGTVVGTGVAI